MVAAAILDERGDAASLTPAQLVEAMAERGLTISQATAQALLRELRSPLSTRLANRRPSREPRPPGPPPPHGTGNGAALRRPRSRASRPAGPADVPPLPGPHACIARTVAIGKLGRGLGGRCESWEDVPVRYLVRHAHAGSKGKWRGPTWPARCPARDARRRSG
jgi:hypothetical protein